METPSPGTEADNPDHAIGDADAFLETPVQTQRCPEDVVHQALSPSPDLQSQRLAIFSLGLFSLDRTSSRSLRG